MQVKDIEHKNRAEFFHGLDLRNKYIHDTNTLDEKRQQHDYMVLLKMFILLVIKINEELCLCEKMSKEEDGFYIPVQEDSRQKEQIYKALSMDVELVV